MAKIIMNISSDNGVANPVQNQWMVLDKTGRYDHVATPAEAQALADAGSELLVPRRWYIGSVEQPGVFLNEYESDPDAGTFEHIWAGPLSEYDEELGQLNPGFVTLFHDLDDALKAIRRLSLSPVPVTIVSADEINNKYTFEYEDRHIIKNLAKFVNFGYAR